MQAGAAAWKPQPNADTHNATEAFAVGPLRDAPGANGSLI